MGCIQSPSSFPPGAPIEWDPEIYLILHLLDLQALAGRSCCDAKSPSHGINRLPIGRPEPADVPGSKLVDIARVLPHRLSPLLGWRLHERFVLG